LFQLPLQVTTREKIRQCPNFTSVGAPLLRHTAVQQHRRHQIGTPPKMTGLTIRFPILIFAFQS
jgi:hypothetical protein